MSVRDGLLSLLGGGPAYGFQLKTRFEEATGSTWDLNVGQVYTTLDRLERDGLVQVDVDDGQKIYRLTAAGDTELEGWWASVPGTEPPPREDLLLKVLMALPHGRDHALDVVSHQRTALMTLLSQRQRAGAAQRAHQEGSSTIASLAADLVADALVMRTEADLRWLDRCEARLLAADEAHFAHGTDDGTSSAPAQNPSRRTWRTRSSRQKATRR